MSENEPNEVNSQIYNYKNGRFHSIPHNSTDTCEKICEDLCRRWSFPPLVKLLFGLRVYGKQIWLADTRRLDKDEKYEFRIRFKVSDRQLFIYFFRSITTLLENENV
jgi:hypothetical protein